MIDNGGSAGQWMLKIESGVTVLASVDCAIRWSNLFSMRLSPLVFWGLVLLQTLATVLLSIGVIWTLWELWHYSSSTRRWHSGQQRTNQSKYFVLCDIPVRVTDDQHHEQHLEVRAKKQIWFTAACTFLEDFIIPCLYFLLYESSCQAFLDSGGNSWFDYAEATIAALAASFLWVVVGSLLLRMATFVWRKQFAADRHTCVRALLFMLFSMGGLFAVAFSMCQLFILGLFLSTQCSALPRVSTTPESTTMLSTADVTADEITTAAINISAKLFVNYSTTLGSTM